MKICLIDFGFYAPHCVLTPLYEYSQILSGKGHDVAVYVRHHKDNLPGSANCKVIDVCGDFLFRKLTHIIFLLKMIRILGEERFDIVHVFNFPGVSLLPIFCRKQHKKWILDIQSVTKEGGLKGFLYDNLAVMESAFFDVINVLNARMKDKLFKGKLAEKVRVIPLGVNIKRFRYARTDRSVWEQFPVGKKDLILVYVGKLDKIRRLENIIEAFKIVIAEHRDKNIKLFFIGGSKKDIERLSKKADPEIIKNKIFFLGAVSYEKIPSFLKSADVGLAYIPKTSSYNIQPPLKTIEYLAAGLPVVATDTDAHLDILQDGVNAVIASDSAEDFAKGMSRILEDDRLRSQIKNNAFMSVLNYDWGILTENLYKICYLGE
ncbi:MAG: glycosyltransferase family 4 protein [Candidatus Omnitrophota bacterium]